MFEDTKITIDKMKDLLYAVQNEFDNELDYDFDYNGREITDDDINLMTYYLKCYVDKVYAVMDDELED
ncbi:MAG: hypothetical protein J6T15_03850 [Bacilli bacterium]|nr:hypothetical protein [Bacilli bacterium]